MQALRPAAAAGGGAAGPPLLHHLLAGVFLLCYQSGHIAHCAAAAHERVWPPNDTQACTVNLQAHAACWWCVPFCRSAFTKGYSVLFLSDGTATANK